MAISYQDIAKANESIKTTAIQGKDYAEVNQRIKAFRMVYPTGTIETEMISNENGVCIFKASVYAHTIVHDDNISVTEKLLLGTGTAYEKENSTFINKTSYIENCETSAVGRALGMCGFGIDTSVASAEEVGNAIANQGEKPERKATAKQIEVLAKVYTGANLEKLLKANGIERLEDISMDKASSIITKLNKNKEERK